MTKLTVNDLCFEVRRSTQRRSLEITVGRGDGLIMSAPPNVPDARLREFAQRKRMWVYKQLAKKEARPIKCGASSSPKAKDLPTWAATTACVWCQNLMRL